MRGLLRNNTSRTARGAGVLASVVLIAACSTALAPGGTRPFSLSFMSAAGGASQARAAARGLVQARDLSLTDAHHALVITAAQLVLDRIELRLTDAAQCEADGGDGQGGSGARDDHGRDCQQMEVGPVLVDVPINAGVVSQLQVTVPAGTYRGLEARLRKPEDEGSGAAAFLSAHPELAGVSVRVTGTFDGQPFTYVGDPEAQLEFRFHPPITVEQGGVNVTVHADLSRWFLAPDSTLVDPSTALPGGANADLVSENIRASFHAFRDDQRDGHDDGEQGDDGDR